jgi:hypothetical protein
MSDEQFREVMGCLREIKTLALEIKNYQKENQEQIMSTFASIQAAELQEHTDLVALYGLVTQLLTAFANGEITPAQAQTLVTQMQGDDATAQTNIAAIQAALGTGSSSSSSASTAASPAGGATPSS